MPSKREDLDKQPVTSEGYTKGNPSMVDENPEFKNRFFSDEYKKNYVYGVENQKK